MAEQRADGVRAARSLFQVRGSGSIPTSALQLRVEAIEFAEAKALNALWHSRLPRMGTGFIKDMPFPCFGAEFDGLLYAAAIWSNPVARLLPQQTWMELRRLAIAPDAPRNTASRMLAVMTRLIRKNRPHLERLVSYQDTAVHTGAIYRVAGWKASQPKLPSNTQWNMPGRPRPKSQSDAPKQCWDKCLVCEMGPTRTLMCEVCRERFPEGRTDAAEPAGTEADVPLPGGQGRTDRRDAPLRPSLWDTSAGDG